MSELSAPHSASPARLPEGIAHWRAGGVPAYSRRWLAARPGPPPRYRFFWRHGAGRVDEACLSQWQPAPFRVGGRDYSCAEQFMMATKAAYFGDLDTREAILAADDPAEMLALGRQVAGFDAAAWKAVRHSVVLTGNYHKFAQNLPMRRFLIGTGDDILVEASPVDAIWGIGHAADDPRARDVGHWSGENLMGFALMEVRDAARRAV